MKTNNIIEISLDEKEIKVLNEAYKILQQIGDIVCENNCYFCTPNEYNQIFNMINDKKVILKKLSKN